MKKSASPTFVMFRGTIIHAAGKDLAPLCGQTNDVKIQNVQQVLAAQPTCKRCLRLLKLRDKNSPEARTRRRFLATRQALRDGRTGIEHFERRTENLVARRKCADLVAAEILKLQKLITALQTPKTA